MSRFKQVQHVFFRHIYFVGPGLVSAVAYVDPGNWATDLQAGAEYGYKLLFIILVAGLAGVVLQLLSVRLGAVTSSSLAHQTRLLFLRLQDKYPKYRILFKCCLWSLYLLAEIAIIGTDLAELIGSAIALNLLFPKLPLFAGVLITASDVLIVLIFFRSNAGRQGMMMFEILIVTLMFAVFVSFIILLHLIRPEWKEVFLGLVPSQTLIQPSALYVGVGIIGATVMPHALFLGSSLSSVDRLNMVPVPPIPARTQLDRRLPSLFRFGRNRHRHHHSSSIPPPSSPIELSNFPARQTNAAQCSVSNISICNHARAESSRVEVDIELDPFIESIPTQRNAVVGNVYGRESEMVRRAESDVDCKGIAMGETLSRRGSKSSEEEAAQRLYESHVRAFDRIKFVDVHLFHATIDTCYSMIGFALTINAAILTLAGAAFYYNPDANPNNADLFGAFDLIKSFIGNGAAIIFALALLCSASITATLAGQIVSEGFIEWKTSPSARRLITRMIGVIPAAIISASVGANGLNTMLVASQVLLSIVLPTVVLPLVYLCSNEKVMTVLGPEIEENGEMGSSVGVSEVEGGSGSDTETRVGETRVGEQEDEIVAGSGGRVIDIEQGEREGRCETIASMGREEERSSSRQSGIMRRKKSYVSPKWVTGLGYALFVVIVVANVYVIVELCLGSA